MKDTSGKSGELVIRAGAAQDATGRRLRPAHIHVREGRIIEIDGDLAASRSARDGGEITCLDMPDRLVLPGFVNAHAHLDLTAMGPAPFQGDFSMWIEEVRVNRPQDEDAIRTSVRRGIDLSLAGGTAIIGDIAGAGSLVPDEVLAESRGLRGVSFIEVFGIGAARTRSLADLEGLAERLIERIRDATGDFRVGLQPHAPYSTAPDVYRKCSEIARVHDLPLCTHLAETEAESEFTRNATGPLADFLRSLGLWDESVIATGEDPITFLGPILSSNRWLLAHVNYATDENLQSLSQADVSIAYCPRTSAYFGHHGHRYREMMEIGINVCLGTDSIRCLDTPGRISIWDEMRLLFRRDGVDPARLLEMATINGATALGFDPALVSLAPGSPAHVNVIPFDPADPTDALAQALQHEDRTVAPIVF